MNKLLYRRNKLAVQYSQRRIINKDFTIISDNCWARELYKQLEINYKTPTIGMGFKTKDFLNLIENLQSPETTKIIQIDSSHCHDSIAHNYIMGKNPFSIIHFLHYKNFPVAERMFAMRYKKINWDNIFYKVDFEQGLAEYEDIKRWNEMKLPNSIAFYSDNVKSFFKDAIHNGVYIKKYNKTTSYVFPLFQYSFDYIHWLNSGRVVNSARSKALNVLLLDPLIANKLKKLIRLKK